MRKLLVKVFLTLSVFVMVFSLSNKPIQAQEIPTDFVEVKDKVLKDFIMLALPEEARRDEVSYYLKKYHGRELKFDYPNEESSQMWLQRVKANTSTNRYTHVLKIRYNKVGIIVDGEKKEVATDTYTYNINPSELTYQSDIRGRLTINPHSVKLVKADHKEQKEINKKRL
ncbi:hypothetical protein [Ectobacillus panaciterrae]|uniref:hypothetical protein n=1 Tax=Ectobacillus panaciterrae TaxID=363872 RepID=UPI00040D378E|nr:hypothetical protein [Ectobacillus panaciterrae]